MTIELCPACGAMDCLCAFHQPDCPACLRPEDECACDELGGHHDYYGDDGDDGDDDEVDDDA